MTGLHGYTYASLNIWHDQSDSWQPYEDDPEKIGWTDPEYVMPADASSVEEVAEVIGDAYVRSVKLYRQRRDSRRRERERVKRAAQRTRLGVIRPDEPEGSFPEADVIVESGQGNGDLSDATIAVRGKIGGSFDQVDKVVTYRAAFVSASEAELVAAALRVMPEEMMQGFEEAFGEGEVETACERVADRFDSITTAYNDEGIVF
jgi:hypothetical protein